MRRGRPADLFSPLGPEPSFRERFGGPFVACTDVRMNLSQTMGAEEAARRHVDESPPHALLAPLTVYAYVDLCLIFPNETEAHLTHRTVEAIHGYEHDGVWVAESGR